MKKLLLNIKICYYSFLDYLDELRTDAAVRLVRYDTTVIERKHQNSKLARGIERLVKRLRGMKPEERLAEENLLGKDPYKKTRREIREELVVRHKLLNNPTLSTTDDLVKKVVKNAPAYAKEQELKEVRKALTACLKRASEDPSNQSLLTEARRLKNRQVQLKREIERIKR